MPDLHENCLTPKNAIYKHIEQYAKIARFTY